LYKYVNYHEALGCSYCPRLSQSGRETDSHNANLGKYKNMSETAHFCWLLTGCLTSGGLDGLIFEHYLERLEQLRLAYENNTP